MTDSDNKIHAVKTLQHLPQTHTYLDLCEKRFKFLVMFDRVVERVDELHDLGVGDPFTVAIFLVHNFQQATLLYDPCKTNVCNLIDSLLDIWMGEVLFGWA